LVDEHDPTMSNLITGLIIAAASPEVQVQVATMKKQGVEVAAGAAVTVETEAGRAIHTIFGEGRSTSDTDRRESTAVEVTVTTEIERKNTTNIVPEKVTNINIAVSIQTKKMIGATVESTKSVIDESIASSNLYTTNCCYKFPRHTSQQNIEITPSFSSPVPLITTGTRTTRPSFSPSGGLAIISI